LFEKTTLKRQPEPGAASILDIAEVYLASVEPGTALKWLEKIPEGDVINWLEEVHGKKSSLPNKLHNFLQAEES
jgi:hypothetical protein